MVAETVQANTCLTSSKCEIGATVVKGSAWNSGNEDWGTGDPGSGQVIRCQSAVAKVKWSGGNKLEATYLLGTGTSCHLYLTAAATTTTTTTTTSTTTSTTTTTTTTAFKTLEERVAALEKQNTELLALAEEHRKRLTNTDSSLGNICELLDRLYDAHQTPEDCCYEEHTDSQTGNFMICMTRTAANLFYGNQGVGVCATSCTNIVPEEIETSYIP